MSLPSFGKVTLKGIINQVILIVLCCGFCLEVMKVETELGNAMYYYRACIFLFTILFCFRRTKCFQLRYLIPALIAALAATFYLVINNSGWGPVYRDLLISKYLAYIFAMVFVLDVIYTGNRTQIIAKGKNPFFIFTVVVFGVALILKPMETKQIIFPMLALYLTPIDKVNWKRLMVGMAIGFYYAFVVCMTYSLRMAPTNYVDGRYTGTFVTLSTSGLLCGTAIISVTFLLLLLWKYEHIRLFMIPLVCMLYVFPTIMFVKIQPRSSELGILFVGAFIFLFLNKLGKRKVAFRGVIFLTVCFLFLITIFLLTKKANIESSYMLRKMDVVVSILKNGGNSSGIIPEERRLLNAFDRFSSRRLSIWIVGMRQVTWFGNNATRVVCEGLFEYDNIHNTFLDYFVRYGWIGGTLLNIWFLWLLVKMVVCVRKREEGMLYPMLWITYCFGFFLFVSQPWERPMSFMLLLFQYPFLVKQYNTYGEYSEEHGEKVVYVFEEAEKINTNS